MLLHCMVLHGVASHRMLSVSHSIVWYFIGLPGITYALHCMVLNGFAWYCIVSYQILLGWWKRASLQVLTGCEICKVPRSFAYSGIFMGSETAAFHLGSTDYYNVQWRFRTGFNIVLLELLSFSDLWAWSSLSSLGGDNRAFFKKKRYVTNRDSR